MPRTINGRGGGVNKNEVVMLVAVYKIGELEVVMECWKMAVCQCSPAPCYCGQVEKWSAGWKCNSVNVCDSSVCRSCT